MDELRDYTRIARERRSCRGDDGYQQVTEKRTKPIVITDPAKLRDLSSMNILPV
ncbi:MAG: hypothetical protein IPG02_17710 [Ignavibacteria bacterium]|nr:hypothetical protein [Ignavibacteria bacterium]